MTTDVTENILDSLSGEAACMLRIKVQEGDTTGVNLTMRYILGVTLTPPTVGCAGQDMERYSLALCAIHEILRDCSRGRGIFPCYTVLLSHSIDAWLAAPHESGAELRLALLLERVTGYFTGSTETYNRPVTMFDERVVEHLKNYSALRLDGTTSITPSDVSMKCFAALRSYLTATISHAVSSQLVEVMATTAVRHATHAQQLAVGALGRLEYGGTDVQMVARYLPTSIERLMAWACKAYVPMNASTSSVKVQLQRPQGYKISGESEVTYWWIVAVADDENDLRGRAAALYAAVREALGTWLWKRTDAERLGFTARLEIRSPDGTVLETGCVEV